jgi:hypothetical protein
MFDFDTDDYADVLRALPHELGEFAMFDGNSAVTDAEGYCRFEGLWEAEYLITCRRKDVTVTVGRKSVDARMSDALDLVLGSRYLVVTVVDARGRAVGGATVRVTSVKDSYWVEATTDRDGRCDVPFVRPGATRVQASARGVVGYGEAVVPNDGRGTVAAIRLPAHGTLRIRVRGGGSVTVQHESGTPRFTKTADESGVIILELAVGRWLIGSTASRAVDVREGEVTIADAEAE